MAAEFGISIGAKISEYLVEPILIRPLRPIFRFQTIADDFQDQYNKLIAIQGRVGNDVRRDRDNALVIYDRVEKWVEKVSASMQEVRRLKNELDENKSCFRFSWCPNWTCHYSFSKQVSKMAATMKTLCEEGSSFSSVSDAPPLHQDIIKLSSSVPFMHSQSSRSAFNQIMEALKRYDANLIGLQGMSGAGKTTLAQQVGKEAKKFFNRVIMVHVSQHPQVRSLQGVIADFLGLKFDQQESEQGRAAKLQQRLNNGEKILLIFDDVKKEFNLGAIIGIPSSDSGCKILLTANAEIHVHTRKHIQLGPLSDDEAWTLLKNIAGVGDEVRTHDAAKDALEQCNGLPKAIVAMGAVLNGNRVLEWVETLQQHNAAKFKFIDGLKEDVKNLSLRQDTVNTKIKMAERNVEVIYPDVEKWLKDVGRVMNDVEQFENELNQNRWCFDELGVATRVEALATCVKDLHEQGKFDQVSHPTPLVQDMGVLPSEDLMFSEAAKSAFDEIMKAWKTDGVNMIGLYGMGGIGKTTLASQVHNEVIRQNALAVMVTVSQKPDVGNMQDKIADFLGLELKEKTLDGRASRLNQRMKSERILVILDDVWKWFDLKSIGIMLDDCKDCKILITTRGRDVCSSMKCQPEIQLHMFSPDESQNFFKKKAGLSYELELDGVAKQIVAECKCLPIALETVGAALKRKGKDEWVEALEKLSNARLVDIIGVDNDEKNVYKCLRVSYDYLNDQPQGSQVQFMLLLCSLFPEDYEIEVEDLTRYAFGMKFFENVDSIEDARRKVRVTIRFLRDSCLLLDSGSEEYVKMHDVVRDVLLWIGGTEPKEKNTFTVRDNMALKDLIRKKSFQNCRALSFTSDVIPKFSKNKLEFPNLEIVLIFMKKDHEFGELWEDFFEHMKHLKVLDFRAERRWGRRKFAMPRSLHCLEYLRTLMLRRCRCSNSSILRDLRSLRILSLHNCEIDCGVEVVSGLKKLRSLDLSRLEAERRTYTSGIIETLVKLEECYGYRFEKCKDEEGTSSRLSKLKLPSNLVALFARVEDMRCLPTDFCFPNLLSYHICIGKYGDMPSSVSQRRHLELKGDIKGVMMHTFKKLFPSVQVFGLSYCHDLYSLPALSVKMLERLEVRQCQKMEWLLKVENVSNNNNSIVQILPLKILELFHLCELRHIWEGPTSLLRLCNLTRMMISDCPKLICIFSSPSLATSLQQLESIKIERCNNLEGFLSRGEGDVDYFSCCCCFSNLRELKVSECDKVKNIFPLAAQSHRCRFPKLERIVLEDNEELEHVFGHQTQAQEGVECPSLQVLDVTCCPKISTTHFVATQLQGPSSKSYNDNYSMNNIQIDEEQIPRRHVGLPHNLIICFSYLKRVELRDCNKLKQVFTTSLVTSLHLLEVLIVERCNELEQVIGEVEDGNQESTIGVCLENLKTLCVTHCAKLKTIFPNSIALPKLEDLKLKRNAELEHVFGRSDWDCTWQCPFLQNLCLEDCPKLCTELACIHNSSTAEAVRKIKVAEAVKKIIVARITVKIKVTRATIKFGHTQEKDERGDDDLLTSPLKELSPWDSEEVKCIQRRPILDICFTDLCQIKVIGCHKLKHLFATKIAAKNLPNLERLIVRRCNELEEVVIVEDGKGKQGNDGNTEMIAEVGFENLKVLRVSNCKKLKTVFSTFIPLPNLQTLVLQNNAALESLFGQSDCDCTSHWTCLNVLSVTGCPKLCTETIAIVRSQLQAQPPTEESSRIIDLANIEGVEELIQFSRQDGGGVNQTTQLHRQLLKVKELGDLKRIWSGPTQDISLSYLAALRVIGCSRLKHLFTTSMATSLRNLKLLSVERCYDLEQVIHEEVNEENTIQSVQQLDFSKLEILRLIDLPKLVSFCPPSCNLVLTKLREGSLKVKGCSKPIIDFFSEQSYHGEEDDYGFEDNYDFEGGDEEEDEFEFKDEGDEFGYSDDEEDTAKFACAIFALSREE